MRHRTTSADTLDPLRAALDTRGRLWDPRYASRMARGGTDRSGDAQALVDELADEIQVRIMTGELAVGSRLRQETLAEEFGVSRTPVREALRQLQASGMLEVHPTAARWCADPRRATSARTWRSGRSSRPTRPSSRPSACTTRAGADARGERRVPGARRGVSRDGARRARRDPGRQAWMGGQRALPLGDPPSRGERGAHRGRARPLPPAAPQHDLPGDAGDSHLLRSNVREHEDIADAIAAATRSGRARPHARTCAGRRAGLALVGESRRSGASGHRDR